MRTLGGHTSAIKTPGFEVTAIHVFTDVAQVWFKERNKRRFRDRIRKLCGGRKKLHVRNAPMKFTPEYKQRFQLKQPINEVLSRCGHGLLNAVELSLELEFKNEDHRQRAFEFVIRRIVKLKHGDQELRFVGTLPHAEKARRFDSYELAVDLGVPEDKISLYTGHRGEHPHVIRVYQGTSKVSEKPCVRIEWIITGSIAVRRAIGSVQDLIDLDHRQFWKRRLRLYDLDHRKLGRLQLRKQESTTPRIIRSGQFSYDAEIRTGQMMFRIAGCTVQGVIDMFGKDINVNKSLYPNRVCDVGTIIGKATPWVR